MPGFDVSPGQFNPGQELDYVEITSTVSVGGTSGAQTVCITGNTIVLPGDVKVLVECFTPILVRGSQAFIIELWDGATEFARWAQIDPTAALACPALLRRYITPSVGSHQFIVKAWINAGTAASFGAGAGSGGSGVYMQAYLRVTVA